MKTEPEKPPTPTDGCGGTEHILAYFHGSTNAHHGKLTHEKALTSHNKGECCSFLHSAQPNTATEKRMSRKECSGPTFHYNLSFRGTYPTHILSISKIVEEPVTPVHAPSKARIFAKRVPNYSEEQNAHVETLRERAAEDTSKLAHTSNKVSQ